MILDVGCGDVPHGNVNMDIQKRENIQNFVLADAHCLPVRDDVFETVYSSHVLEHCKHPYQVLAEFKRATKKRVIVKVPNVGLWDINDKTHIYSWSKFSFEQLLQHHFNNVTVYFDARPHSFFDHRLLRKYSLVRRLLATIHSIATFVYLHLAKNELLGIGYK